ncbi:uncharacterized protein CIMG_10801 [Coccidioides immitis RS]|uniref:Uncharacterized protein n=1 Tax=Coccidioides immitis (strain RS) TaxID=246410 RepID=A0A0D8JS29_COCIM|nr:uncharacterized protein CIMG_10801 [Coccidioides immitis RS]KJF60125.1 hypothetical protein CIMG_10801 [Coccidioides immitis RS]
MQMLELQVWHALHGMMYQKIAVDSPDGFKTGQITVIRSQIDKGFRLLNRNRNRNSAPGYEAKSKRWCVGHYQQTRSPKLHKTTALLHHVKRCRAVHLRKDAQKAWYQPLETERFNPVRIIGRFLAPPTKKKEKCCK